MSETLRTRAVLAPWKWWTGFFAIVAVAGGLSLLAYRHGLPEELGARGVDKAMHFAVAGLLAFFLDGAVRRRTLVAGHGFSIPVAAALVLVPAAIEEYAQRYSENRSSSIWDFVADVSGVIFFTALSRRVAE